MGLQTMSVTVITYQFWRLIVHIGKSMFVMRYMSVEGRLLTFHVMVMFEAQHNCLQFLSSAASLPLHLLMYCSNCYCLGGVWLR